MVTTQDTNTMQTYGRYAARDNDQVAMEKAAENLAIVGGSETEDGARLHFWLLEGVRNYAGNQSSVDRIMNLITKRSRELME